MKSIMEMTRDDFLAIPYSRRNEIGEFTGFVIVPTGELHDSGFGCMKFILTKSGKVAGAVGGYCDVVHLNGIGGYGRNLDMALKSRLVPVIDWTMDLLPKSGCLRVFCSHNLILDDFICSDFEVYDGGVGRNG